jgi:hypothetical protein
MWQESLYEASQSRWADRLLEKLHIAAKYRPSSRFRHVRRNHNDRNFGQDQLYVFDKANAVHFGYRHGRDHQGNSLAVLRDKLDGFASVPGFKNVVTVATQVLGIACPDCGVTLNYKDHPPNNNMDKFGSIREKIG